MTQTESMQAEASRVRQEIAGLRRTCRSLADQIESYEVAIQGPEAVAKEIRRLEALTRTVEVTADQWRQTVRVLERERFVLQRKVAER